MSHAPSDTPRPGPARPAGRRLAHWAGSLRRGYLVVYALGCLDVFCAAGLAFGLAAVLEGVRRGAGPGPGLACVIAALGLRAAFGYAYQKLAARLARRVIHDLRLGLIERMLRGRGARAGHEGPFST